MVEKLRAVLITDSAERIEYVNPAFAGTTGFTREDALGKTPHHDQEVQLHTARRDTVGHYLLS